MKVKVKCPSCFHSTPVNAEVFLFKEFTCPMCGRDTDISPYCKEVEDFKRALEKVRKFGVKEEILLEIDVRRISDV